MPIGAGIGSAFSYLIGKDSRRLPFENATFANLVVYVGNLILESEYL